MMVVMVAVHIGLLFGAVGISFVFPSSLLQPSPSQILQWLTLAQREVSVKQPRSIDDAKRGKKR